MSFKRLATIPYMAEEDVVATFSYLWQLHEFLGVDAAQSKQQSLPPLFLEPSIKTASADANDEQDAKHSGGRLDH